MMRRPRIAFVHNRCVPYREEVFHRLSQDWDIDFFFARQRDIPIPVRYKVFNGFRIPEASDYEIVPGLLPELLRRRPYDLYNCTDVGYFITHVTFLAARLKGRPFVLWGGDWMQTAHPRRYLMRPLEDYIIRHSAAHIAYGSRSKQFLVDHGARAERVFMAYNSTPISLPQITEKDIAQARRDLGLNDHRVVLFLGRLVKFKGMEHLIRAFAQIKERHPRASLLLAGTGPEEKRLRRLVAQLQLPGVVITGKWVDEWHKALYLSMADVFVLPSIYFRNPEPWGLVLNEAATFGKPLVATDMVGAAYDLIEEGRNGFIVPQKSAEALAQAIEAVLSDDSRRTSMGEASRRLSQRFSTDQMVEAIGKAFQLALDETVGAARR